jgi:hypothetical protein
VGGACSTYGERRYALVGYLSKRDYLEDPGVDSAKMDIQEVGCGVMEWIELVQDRDRWRALVITIMNTRVP